jgi:hypothetical protein
MADRTVTLTAEEWAHVIAFLTIRGESGSPLARVYADVINSQVKGHPSTPVREVPRTLAEHLYPVREAPRARTSKEVHEGVPRTPDDVHDYIRGEWKEMIRGYCCNVCGKHYAHPIHAPSHGKSRL